MRRHELRTGIGEVGSLMLDDMAGGYPLRRICPPFGSATMPTARRR